MSFSHHVVHFCHFLRCRGMPVAMSEEIVALEMLAYVDIADIEQFRLSLRAVLAKNREHQSIFDVAFAEFWCGEGLNSPGGRDVSAMTNWETTPQSTLTLYTQATPETFSSDKISYSPVETIGHKNFSQMTAPELEAMRKIIEMLARRLACRLSRRYRPQKRSLKLDLRRTMRQNLSYGGEILSLCCRRRRRSKLRLVTLCDVSGSMELYSRFFLEFIYTLQKFYSGVETFAFSTVLQHITRLLRKGDFEQALAQIADNVLNWSGGTRIGVCLRDFGQGYGELLSRNTVVLIVSDGWDTGDSEVLQRAMQHLQRRSRMVVWLNPWLGSEGYEPTCRGMRTALPYIDVFSSVRDLDSLRRLARYLSNCF